MKSFQDLIFTLQTFWSERGCLVVQPYDTEKGAGTMSPHTFLKALGPTPYKMAYVEPCRRPADGRYAENPNRLQHYYQFQVIMKPSPMEIQSLYIESLEAIGISGEDHDIRFVEDNWEAPTLGAWGLGWEVWLDGMEITQFTYFQQCGGIECDPVTVELTYGLERLAMFIQKKDHFQDIVWQVQDNQEVTYGSLFKQFEIEQCHYNFKTATVKDLMVFFETYEKEAHHILESKLALPAYDYCLKCSHTFNLLDARGAISVTERMVYIARIRKLAQRCAEVYLESQTPVIVEEVK